MSLKPNLPPGYDPRKDKIEIVDYDPTWPKVYVLEDEALRKLLGGLPGLVFEHFGSTSIPGLAAKPIIDIMVAVESRDLWPRLVEPIQSLGYVYWSETPQKEEMFFVKGMPPFGERRTHHVHVYDFQGPRWRKELSFRDYLRAHPDEMKRYEILKRNLAVQFTYDREAYTEAKTEYLQSVMKKIGEG